MHALSNLSLKIKGFPAQNTDDKAFTIPLYLIIIHYVALASDVKTIIFQATFSLLQELANAR